MFLGGLTICEDICYLSMAVEKGVVAWAGDIRKSTSREAMVEHDA